MKLLQAVAYGLVLSLAAMVQGQPASHVAPDRSSPIDVREAQTVSADVLRHPLRGKVKQVLGKAQSAADAGDHYRAIGLLRAALAKYPESAAWTQSMLGVEFLKTNQFAAAVDALEQAVSLLPRDAVDHSNFGLALAQTGQYHQAELELRRALALDSSDPKTTRLLDIVIERESAEASSGQSQRSFASSLVPPR